MALRVQHDFAVAALAAVVGWASLRGTAPRAPQDIDLVAAAARSGELPGGGRSERLIVALFDPSASVAAGGNPAAEGDSAAAIVHAHDVDDFNVELDELLSAGGAR